VTVDSGEEPCDKWSDIYFQVVQRSHFRLRPNFTRYGYFHDSRFFIMEKLLKDLTIRYSASRPSGEENIELNFFTVT